ncbi:MAG TPA: amidohydrolase family protein, partial [Candidatus Limnocylindrales bacterium]|nr:amidohydrolase family protein [Candidatus Limnocylindrales bacterium]
RRPLRASLRRVDRSLPEGPPFVLRARVLTPLDDGGYRYEPDGIVAVDAAGRIEWVGPAREFPAHELPAHELPAHELPARDLPARELTSRSSVDRSSVLSASVAESVATEPSATLGSAAPASTRPAVVDVRPLVVLPGLVDLHAHLPQLPNAGLGFGLDLLTWLERYVFPLERAFRAEAAERLVPAALATFAAAGTTTVVLYGAVYEDSLEVAFRAAEAHGIRAVIGKVMMDRITYDPTHSPTEILDLSLRQSADLCARWNGRDDGRLRYAFTPRFAVSCTFEMLRESARLAAEMGAYWQTHLSEDRGEIAEVRRLFPDALDYLDVYDRAGGLSERAILAHAIHLSDREVERLAESGARVAHCPASNLFLASGVMPLARYLEAGIAVGLGSDVAGGPDPSIFSAMRVGAYTQNALRVVGGDPRPILGPLDWLRLASLEGARALGIEGRTGSIEVGKEADLILVDPRLTAPVRGAWTPRGAGRGTYGGRARGTGPADPARVSGVSAVPADPSGAPGVSAVPADPSRVPGVSAVPSDPSGAPGAAPLADPSIVPDDPGVLADPSSVPDDPAALMSRLIFRGHPAMVRAAWVRGRRLPTEVA